MWERDNAVLSYCCYNSAPHLQRNLNWNQAKTRGQHLLTAVRLLPPQSSTNSVPHFEFYLFLPGWCVWAGLGWKRENIQMKYFLKTAWYFLFLIYAASECVLVTAQPRPSISVDISIGLAGWLTDCGANTYRPNPHHQSEYKENCDGITTDNYFISKI